jgi:NUMOD3 motif
MSHDQTTKLDAPGNPEKQISNKPGRKQTPETIAKIRATLTGRRRSPEHNARIGASHRGLRHSPETLAKMRRPRKRPDATLRPDVRRALLEWQRQQDAERAREEMGRENQ